MKLQQHLIYFHVLIHMFYNDLLNMLTNINNQLHHQPLYLKFELYKYIPNKYSFISITFLTYSLLKKLPILALESTAIIIPPLNLKPNVVVPCLKFVNVFPPLVYVGPFIVRYITFGADGNSNVLISSLSYFQYVFAKPNVDGSKSNIFFLIK